MLTQNKRINQRTTREDTYCLLDDMEPQFQLVEISANGFSFACDREDTRFKVNVDLPDISIVNGEAQEIIHAAGVIRHRSQFDAHRDRVGVSFSSKRFDNTITGRVRLPRHRPSLDLGATVTANGNVFYGKVVDYNIRSARLEMSEPISLAAEDSVRVALGSGTRRLFDGEAVVLRSDPESPEIVVEFTDNFLELHSIFVTEKAISASTIIEEKQSAMKEFAAVSPEYRALIFDWHMYLEMVEGVLDREESKGLLVSEEDQRHYVEEILPAFNEQMREFISKLNAISPNLSSDEEPLYKRLLHERLEHFIRCSVIGASVMDKLHGYLGDYETVKLFFSERFTGPTLFSKLMNGFVHMLEPVKAHVARISYIYDQIVSAYEASENGIRILNLGSGPAEEILRLLRENEFDKPVHITLIDQDAHALADFYERAQPWLNPKVEIELMNFNVFHILVGKPPTLHPEGYDIAYCAGMLDYFKDRICRKFVDFLISTTKIGGTFLYTNVHSRNFARYFMDYSGGWEIYHRDDQETLALAPSDQICEAVTESTGTNVFINGTRVVACD